jgi:uncharacterized protein
VILVDVNVLVGGFRSDSVHHDICKNLLDDALAGPRRFAVSPLALSAMVRIVTNPKIFKAADHPTTALSFCALLLDAPNSVAVEPGERHWAIFADLCIRINARGNLVPDTWFAALAIEHGCEWITLDRDFAQFPGLQWRLLRH